MRGCRRKPFCNFFLAMCGVGHSLCVLYCRRTLWETCVHAGRHPAATVDSRGRRDGVRYDRQPTEAAGAGRLDGTKNRPHPLPINWTRKGKPCPWPRKTWQGKPPPIRCRLWSFGCSRLHLALRLPEGSRRTRRHRLGRPPRSGHHLARRAVSQPGMREFAHRAFPGKSRLRPSSRAIAHAASTERRGMGRCPQRCRQHG